MSGHGAPQNDLSTFKPEETSQLKLAIVAASWHTQIMDGLLDGAHVEQESLDLVQVVEAEAQLAERPRLHAAQGRHVARHGTADHERHALDVGAVDRSHGARVSWLRDDSTA